jgi:thiol-disulfide isomerase/thioredoxin
MKKIIAFAIAAFAAGTSFAQGPEITVESDGTKVAKGFLTTALLVSDSAFKWFPATYKASTPNGAAVQGFRAGKDSVYILAFGGTWCDDTKQILPKVYATADAAGIAPERITLVGVDRAKKTVAHLSEAFNITNVPTFIVMKNGKEIGRVVEWGKTGQPEKELAEIVGSAGSKK